MCVYGCGFLFTLFRGFWDLGLGKSGVFHPHSANVVNLRKGGPFY